MRLWSSFLYPLNRDHPERDSLCDFYGKRGAKEKQDVWDRRMGRGDWGEGSRQTKKWGDRNKKSRKKEDGEYPKETKWETSLLGGQE